MSPYEVKLLLHIYSVKEPIPYKDTPLLDDTLDRFFLDNLIKPCYDQPRWYVTEKGKRLCEKICSVEIE